MAAPKGLKRELVREIQVDTGDKNSFSIRSKNCASQREYPARKGLFEEQGQKVSPSSGRCANFKDKRVGFGKGKPSSPKEPEGLQFLGKESPPRKGGDLGTLTFLRLKRALLSNPTLSNASRGHMGAWTSLLPGSTGHRVPAPSGCWWRLTGESGLSRVITGHPLPLCQ